jgi:nitrate reductase gamma subunit
MFDAPIWDAVFWGNTVTRWVIAAGVTLGILVVLGTAVSFLARQVRRLVDRTVNDTDDLVAELLDKTKLLFLLIVAVWGGSQFLEVSPRAAQILRSALVLGVLVQVGVWATSIVSSLLVRDRN